MNIAWLMKHWKFVLAAIAALFIFWGGWRIHTILTDISTLSDRLKDEKEKVAARDAIIAIQEKKIHDDQERAEARNAIAAPIARAKGTADDGPLAPVARAGLERLRARRAGHP